MENRHLLYTLLLTVFTVCTTKTIPAAFLAKYLTTKGITNSSVGMLFACFPFAGFVFAPIGGAIVLRVGPTVCLCVSLLVSIFCNVLMAFSGVYWQYLVVRIVMGVATIAFTTSMYSLCPFLFPSHLTLVIGLVETTLGVGAFTGKFVGGVLFQLGGFALPFIMTACVLFLCLILCVRFLLAVRTRVNPSGSDDVLVDQRLISLDKRERSLSDHHHHHHLHHQMDPHDASAPFMGFMGYEHEHRRETERGLVATKSPVSGWHHREQLTAEQMADLDTTDTYVAPIGPPTLTLPHPTTDTEGYIQDLHTSEAAQPSPTTPPLHPQRAADQSPMFAASPVRQDEQLSSVPSLGGLMRQRYRRRTDSGDDHDLGRTATAGSVSPRFGGRRGGVGSVGGQHKEGAYGSHVTYWQVMTTKVLMTLVGVFLTCMCYSFPDPVLPPRINSFLGPLSSMIIGLLMGLQSCQYTLAALLTGRAAQKFPHYTFYMALGYLAILLGYCCLGPLPPVEAAGVVRDHSPAAWVVLVLALSFVPWGNALSFVPSIPLLHEDVDEMGPAAKELVVSLCVCSMSLGETAGPLLGGSLTSATGFEWACTAMAFAYGIFGVCFVIAKRPFAKITLLRMRYRAQLPTFRLMQVSPRSHRRAEAAEPLLLEEGGMRVTAVGAVPPSPAPSARSVRTLGDLLGQDPVIGHLTVVGRPHRLPSEAGTIGRTETVVSGVTALSRASYFSALSQPAATLVEELPSTGLVPFTNPEMLLAITSVNAAASALLINDALDRLTLEGDLADEPERLTSAPTQAVPQQAATTMEGTDDTAPLYRTVTVTEVPPAAVPTAEAPVPAPVPSAFGVDVTGKPMADIEEGKPLQMEPVPPLVLEGETSPASGRAAGAVPDGERRGGTSEGSTEWEGSDSSGGKTTAE